MIFLRAIFQIHPWLAAGLAFLILGFSISGQSIDMDEAQTWDYTRLSSLSEFWEELRTDSNSESQMPIGMLSLWGWCRVVGTGEMAARTINLVWVAIALAALAVVARETAMPWLPLLFTLQPFVWYSMDQARTPVMQMAGGALLLAGMILLLKGSQRRLAATLLLSFGSIILCGASMLGAVPLLVVMVLLVASAAWRRILLSRAAKIALFITASVLAVLGFYYLSTLARGSGGAKLWAVSPFNLIFVVYEFLGFVGLGPGRQELREIMRGTAPASQIVPFAAGWIGLLVGYGLVVGAAVKSWLTRSESGPRNPPFPLWLLCASVPLLSALLLFCLATAVGFPFWGRHLAGALPFAVTALAIGLHWSMQGLWRRAGRVGSLLVVVMLVFGLALIRLSPIHRHDDYRSAANMAAGFARDGLSVWWVADHSGGSYYGLVFDRNVSGIEIQVNESGAFSHLPDAVILSRPENFDNRGTVSQMILDSGYRRSKVFQAFEVWER